MTYSFHLTKAQIWTFKLGNGTYVTHCTSQRPLWKNYRNIDWKCYHNTYICKLTFQSNLYTSSIRKIVFMLLCRKKKKTNMWWTDSKSVTFTKSYYFQKSIKILSNNHKLNINIWENLKLLKNDYELLFIKIPQIVFVL